MQNSHHQAVSPLTGEIDRPQVLWTRAGSVMNDTWRWTTLLADVDGDNADEVFVTGSWPDSRVSCLNGSTGETVWTSEDVYLGGVKSIVDIDDDGSLELICVENGSTGIDLLDARTGEVDHELPGVGRVSMPTITPIAKDVDGDGWKELLLTDGARRVFLYSVKNDTEVWTAFTDTMPVTQRPWGGFVEVDLPGFTNFAFQSGSGILQAMDISTGDFRYWEGHSSRMVSTHELISLDTNGDRYDDILAPWMEGGTSYIIAMDGRFQMHWHPKVLWKYEADVETGWGGNSYVPMAAGDLEADGHYEIIVFDKTGNMHVVNATNGSAVHVIDTGIIPSREPTLVDISNDGILDILVGTEDGHVVALDGRTHSEVWRFDMGSRVATPVVAGDLDGDGLVELVVSDADGDLVALRGLPRPSVQLESPGPATNTTLYAAHGPYTFRVMATSGWDAGYLKDITVELDPDGTGIVLAWDRETGKGQVQYGSEHVTLEGCNATSDGTNWTVEFDLRFPWTFPHEESCDVVVGLRNMALRTGGGSFDDVFRVETDVELAGPYEISGEWQGPLEQGDWVRGGEEIMVSGPIVRYEGSDNVTALISVTAVARDYNGNPSAQALEPGEALRLKIIGPMDFNGVLRWRFGLIDIPIGCEDRTDMTLTLGVTNMAPKAVVFSPAVRDWLTEGTVECSIGLIDNGPGIDPESVEVLVEGGDWQLASYNRTEDIVDYYTIYVQLEEGKENLVQWRWSDLVGNGAETLKPLELWVDTMPVEFGEADPRTWSSGTVVNVSIPLSDSTSGVNRNSIEYRLDGGEWTGADVQWDAGIASVVLELPEGITELQWRASDMAGNGPTKSTIHDVKVDRTPPILESLDPGSGLVSDEEDLSILVDVVDGLSGVSDDHCTFSLVEYLTGETSSIDGVVDLDGLSATIRLDATLVEGWWNISLHVSDVADNIAVIDIGDYGIDLSPPTLLGEWPAPDNIRPDEPISCTITVAERISGIVIVEWRAWWPDNPPGDWMPATWDVLGSGLPFTAYSDPILFPPGNEGRIEWRAVDGVGRETLSGPLGVWVNRPPVASISSPSNGGTYSAGGTLELVSGSTDPDDHDLVETWFSDIDGELGRGNKVLASLSEGEHVLTLRVEDPKGGVDETSIRVEVTEMRISDASLIVLVLILAVLGTLILIAFLRNRAKGEG
jgi:outer membrane protein assembly factor BamB